MLLSVEDLTVRIGRIEPLAGLSFTLDRGHGWANRWRWLRGCMAGCRRPRRAAR